MIFGPFGRLFSARWRQDNGASLRAAWVKSRGRMLLVNPGRGTVIADLHDDNHGKFEATVFATPLEALRLIRQGGGFVVSLLAFPRLTVELAYLPAANLREAQTMLAELLRVGDR